MFGSGETLPGDGETLPEDNDGGERNGGSADADGFVFAGALAGLGRVAGGLEPIQGGLDAGRTAAGGLDGEAVPVLLLGSVPDGPVPGVGRTAGTLLDTPTRGLPPAVEG